MTTKLGCVRPARSRSAALMLGALLLPGVPRAAEGQVPIPSEPAVPAPDATPPAPQSLAGAIALAFRSNPTLQATRYDLKSIDERLAQARAELRPTAGIQASAGYEWTFEGRISARSNFFSPTSTAQSRAQTGFSVEQPLYTSGRATADRRSAEATVSASNERLRSTEGDLLLQVVTAYLDVERLEQECVIRTDSVSELKKLQREIEARQEAGELTHTDIAQAGGQIAQAEAQLVQTEQALEASRADFVSLVGAMPGRLLPPPPLPNVPASPERAFQLAEQISPELAYARFTEQASRDGIAAARAASGPSVSLKGSASLSGPVYPYAVRDQDKAYSGSVVLSVPLMAGGRTASQIRDAKARNAGDLARIEAARRELVRSVSNAWNQIAAADRIATITESRRASAETQLDGMLSEYRLGLRSTFDLLYAQQTLRDAEVATLDAGRDEYLSRATLLRKVGLLEAEDIVTGVPGYDPRAYANKARHANRLPLDGAIRALDTLGATSGRQRHPLKAPAPATHPAIAASPAPGPDHPAFVARVPLTPLPGTTADTPSTRPHRKQHQK